MTTKRAAWLVVLAWMAGCSSSPVANDAAHVADAAGTADSHADVACGSADASNDPRCPATYASAPCGQACANPDLTCAYPGVGDGPDSRGCFATAMAWCKVPLGGADGSATSWVCAQ